jgi:hypothetical protein
MLNSMNKIFRVATVATINLATLVGSTTFGDETSKATTAVAPSKIAWDVKPLALDANEGVAIGDIDGNRSLDIVAGRNWYPAPDFVPRPLRAIEDWNGYIKSNGDFLYDINGDGRLDVVAGDFIGTEVAWFENPGDEPLRLCQTWKRHLLMDTKLSQNEAQLLQDLDGDGLPEWIVNSWSPKNPLMIYRFAKVDSPKAGEPVVEVIATKISETGNKHGLGAGDLNGDGKIDILTGGGWFEQPIESPWTTAWKYHPDWDIHASIPMLVHDVDGDGLNDMLYGMGHDYGLYFWRQKGTDKQSSGETNATTIQFEQQLIDKNFSQPHALALADIDLDGKLDLITGKRYYTHNGKDPGGKEMPEMNSYRYNAATKTFDKSVIEQGHVGVGLQIATSDINGDGKVDIAVAGKSGTYLILQK